MTRLTIVLTPLTTSAFDQIVTLLTADPRLAEGRQRNNSYKHFAYTPSGPEVSSDLKAKVALLVQKPTATKATLANIIFRYADFVCIVDIPELGESSNPRTFVGIGDDGALVGSAPSVAFGAAFANGIPLLIAANADKASKYIAHAASHFEGLKVLPLPPLKDAEGLLEAIDTIVPLDSHFTNASNKTAADLQWHEDDKLGGALQVRLAGGEVPVASGNAALSPYVADYAIRCLLPTRLSLVCEFSNLGVHLCFVQQGTVAVGNTIITTDPDSATEPSESIGVEEMRVFPSGSIVETAYAGQFVSIKMKGSSHFEWINALSWGSALSAHGPEGGPTVQSTWLAHLYPVEAHKLYPIQVDSGFVVTKDGNIPQFGLLRDGSTAKEGGARWMLEMGTGIEASAAPLDTHLHCLPSVARCEYVMYMGKREMDTPNAYSLHVIAKKVPRIMGFVVALAELQASQQGPSADAPKPISFPFPNVLAGANELTVDSFAKLFSDPFGPLREPTPNTRKRLLSSLADGLLAEVTTPWLEVNKILPPTICPYITPTALTAPTAPTDGEEKDAAPTDGEEKDAAPTDGEAKDAAPTDGEAKDAAPTDGEEEEEEPPTLFDVSPLTILSSIKVGSTRQQGARSSGAMSQAIALVVANRGTWTGMNRLYVSFFGQPIDEEFANLPAAEGRLQMAIDSLVTSTLFHPYYLPRIIEALSQAEGDGGSIGVEVERRAVTHLVDAADPSVAYVLSHMRHGWSYDRISTMVSEYVCPSLLLEVVLRPATGLTWPTGNLNSYLSAFNYQTVQRWAAASGLPTPMKYDNDPSAAHHLHVYAMLYLFSNVCRVKKYAIQDATMLRIAQFI